MPDPSSAPAPAAAALSHEAVPPETPPAARLRIEDYALIGDCRSAALVGIDGSIDWLCWPRFDSPACFAALLGGPENGFWRIAPDGAFQATRAYQQDTLILRTRFVTDTGVAELVDCMPVNGERSDVLRMVVGISGTVSMRMAMTLRFDYGKSVPWVSRLADGGLRAIAGPDMVVLRGDPQMRGENMSTVAEFTVAAGERVRFDLAHVASWVDAPPPIDVETLIQATETCWRDWAKRCTYTGPHEALVRRSLLTLKALTYRPTGGIVAAPTTSLPERIGGERNWDYRYGWLRDSTLTLFALLDAGFTEEALAWRAWLRRAIAGAPAQLQIMYGIRGERRLSEHELPWLAGYEQSRPVRIGNGAATQRQLDVYGEVLDTLYQARRSGLPLDEDSWALERAMVEHLATVWREPDEGIWEIRAEPQHFTCSKVLAWVAVDRAVRTMEEYGLQGPLDAWRALRDEMHAEICARAYDPELGCFVQAYGSKLLDAATLAVALTGFLAVDDPRVTGTIAAIERGLQFDGLVLRYDTGRTEDGLPPGEGAFLACSFWLIDAMVLQGRIEEAQARFDRLLRLTNDVGLLAEEYDPRACRMLGNFPQAFSHVGLVVTAMNLARATKPAEQRAQPGRTPDRPATSAA